MINSSTTFATETVTKAGTYRVEVSYSSGTVTAGGFRLSRQSLRTPCDARTIRCGDNLAGRLDQLSEMDAYTFNGTAGDPIKLQIGSSKVNGFDPQIRLYAPDGDFLNSSSIEIARTLSQTGVYKVLVLQSSGTARIGDYGLTLQNTRTPCNALVLNCGALRYGTIRGLAEFNTYTFTATANEPFMLWMVTTTRDANSPAAGSYFNVEMELYSPTGARLISRVSSESGEIVRTPTVSGTYTLIVHSATGDEAGDYQLSYQRLKNPCNPTPLSSCQRIKTAISAQAEIDAYAINGTAGQTLPLQAIGETTLFTPDANFYDPDGVLISTSRPLTKTGLHTLIVRAQGGTGMTGNYTVSVGGSTITVTAPLPGEMLIAGTTERIAWEASSTSTGTTFDLRLSTDGGATYPTTIATNIPRTTLFYNWAVPANLVATRARIRVVSKDVSGNSCQTSSDADFFVISLGAGSTVTYKYDDLNQLIEASYDNGVKYTYTYDEVGNRLSEVVTVPNAPTVVATAAATQITQVSARLNGNLIISNGAAASYRFEWGRSSTLANSSLTPVQQIGGAGGTVTADLNGLIPGTVYYFRLVGASGAETIRGEIRSFTTAAALPMTTVSAASFARGAMASGAIISIFGQNLATGTEIAQNIPLPTTLAGTTVRVTDSKGAERLAPLFFVAPSQINCLIPEGTDAGSARIVVLSADGSVSAESVEISAVAPSLFTANASGSGLAAGNALRVKADGTQVYEPISRFDPDRNQIVAVPLDLGPATDAVFLILYGTGIKARSDLSAVRARIGGVDAQVLYAGLVAGLAGLDQINLNVPRSLIGRGVTEIVISVDGKAANTVQVVIGPVTAAAPTLASISPSTAPAGSSALTLTANGTNFTGASVVRWNNGDRPTTLVSSTQLRASISASDLASAGAANVLVFNSDGGGGSNSVSFQITPVCTYAILPAAQSFGAGSGNGSVSVTAANGCNWTATSNANWITINSGGTGNGNGTVTYTVAANAGTNSRTGTLSIASQTFSVTQAGAAIPPPTIGSLNPGSVIAGGVAFTLTVNGTNFSAASVVRLNGGDRPTTFVGTTQLRGSIPASDIAVAGTANIAVFSPDGGGLSNIFPLTIAPPCAYSISPAAQAVGAEGGGGTVSVSAASGCAWTATSGVNWITINSGNTGNGNGTVTYSVAPNVGAARTGTLAIASQIFSVTQAGTGNAAPVIASLNPVKAAPCSPAFSLLVNGTGFVSGSVVQWKGVNRTTAYISSTQLRADIPATDLTSPGTAAITVINPAPGSGISNAVNFSIEDPAVSVQSILTGQVVSGSLTTSDQVQRGEGCTRYYFDGFIFATTAANTTVAIDLRSTQFDAEILLYRVENDQLIFVSSDGLSGGYGNGRVENNNALLLTVLPTPGVYVIFATTANENPGGLGDYTLRLDMNVVQPIAYGANLSNAGISTADLQTSAGTHLDAYWFTGAANDNVQITMRSTSFDSFLILYDRQGAIVASNDNGAGGLDAQINFRLPASGIYIIFATPYEPNKTGAYNMTLNKTTALAVSQAIAPNSNLRERTVPMTGSEKSLKTGDAARHAPRRVIRSEPRQAP
ncbi:MAG: BACON domain-containing carbohydrate-binding protein [Blastocatellia bacterium]|nr:BACON domain-containing carbohydrate-binding protein [Blastocatellia bacterium]